MRGGREEGGGGGEMGHIWEEGQLLFSKMIILYPVLNLPVPLMVEAGCSAVFVMKFLLRLADVDGGFFFNTDLFDDDDIW